MLDLILIYYSIFLIWVMADPQKQTFSTKPAWTTRWAAWSILFAKRPFIGQWQTSKGNFSYEQPVYTGISSYEDCTTSRIRNRIICVSYQSSYRSEKLPPDQWHFSYEDHVSMHTASDAIYILIKVVSWRLRIVWIMNQYFCKWYFALVFRTVTLIEW